MATTRRIVLDFMLLNHDEDLIERFSVQWRGEVPATKAVPIETDATAPAPAKYPIMTTATNGHERVAVSR